MEKLNKKGVLLIMSNANGWRNPAVYGGAEIKTSSIVSKLDEFDWYVILPNQLFFLFKEKFAEKHIHYFPIKTLFKKTNVLKDIVQGLLYTPESLVIGWKLRDKYSLIYSATTNFSDIFPAKLISLITHKPYVCKYHISIYDEPKVLRIYKNFREEKNSILDSFIRAILARITISFLKNAKLNLTVCDYLGEQLKRCGVDEQKIKTNYNGLDFNEMAKYKTPGLQKKFDLCFIGRIEKNKGILDILDVAKEIKASKEDFSVVIIGDGSYLKEVRREIKVRGLGATVIITGFLDIERYKLLQQSRIFVSPTYAKEGFGLTLLEALFFNVPIIAYTHPVFVEVFGDDRSVKLIEPSKDIFKSVILKTLKEKYSYPSNLDTYSLENCVKREKLILHKLI